jgi:hypothetical protein
MQVEIVTKQRVIEQEIGGKSMEDYMSEKLIEIENQKLDLLVSDMIVKGYKQLNVRHKNIIDAQRLELKQLEFNNLNKESKES